MKNNQILWESIYAWLKLCGNKISRSYIKLELTTHPDYPALTSVADFLENGKFSYKAVQADESYINLFNYPLLAHIKEPAYEYLQLITSIDDWKTKKYLNWSGIVLYPELNSKWENATNNRYLKVEKNNKIVYTFITLIALLLLFYSSYNTDNKYLTFIFGLLSISGFIFSLQLISSELGNQSQIIKDFCGAVSSGGCEKVLQSSYAKGLFGITLADMAIIYFASQYIVYIISFFYLSYINAIILFSFFGLFVSFISIYIQALKIKQYCTLCLCIGAILITQFIIILCTYRINSLLIHNLLSLIDNGFLLFIITSLIGFLILLPIKNTIKLFKKNELKIIEFKKWKLNSSIFLNQWKIEKPIDTEEWENDLILGNKNAPDLITVACNLYCEPCARTHKKLDELLVKYKHIVKIQLRLLCYHDDINNIKTISVDKILQQSFEINNTLELQEMVNDWFYLMDLKKWSLKWKRKSKIDTTTLIYKHSMWMIKNSVTKTPTIFWNGRKIPDCYTLEDFESLIPHLAK